MTNTPFNKYKFAIGKKIKQVFIESELYLDRKYDEYVPCQNLSVRRIDKPLFLLLDNNVLVRLAATSFSVADDYTREYVFSKDFTANPRAQKEFKKLCDLTIVDVQELYQNEYTFEDDFYGHWNQENDFKEEISDFIILLDNGLRLISYSFFDYFDIELVEKDQA